MIINDDTPFVCMRMPGVHVPVYRIYDRRTGKWSQKTYIMEAGLREGEADAAKLNRLYKEMKKRYEMRHL